MNDEEWVVSMVWIHVGVSCHTVLASRSLKPIGAPVATMWRVLVLNLLFDQISPWGGCSASLLVDAKGVVLYDPLDCVPQGTGKLLIQGVMPLLWHGAADLLQELTIADFPNVGSLDLLGCIHVLWIPRVRCLHTIDLRVNYGSYVLRSLP